ncbi:hypothetical protein KC318_g1039 [Hortaea werneckii]|nr:hypothetical protein KC334_g4662 [Hortaea werneckii]KAI7011618.1 hypothetical protein KC355_g5714 [Hortaea werneckii]KAI7675305.1 hypothetical protein KC318_g1039 [Hortaea werneckii]
MKPTTSNLLILAAATASASGLKTPLQGIADAAQSPFAGKHEKPLTLSARDDVRVSHRAEMAEAYLSIRACDADADKANENGEHFLNNLKHVFSDAGLNTTVTSPTTVKTSSDDDYDNYAFRSRRMRGGKNKHDDDEADEDEKQCASSSILVFVHDLDLLSTLNTNLTSDTGAHARVTYINWQLSEATKAAQKSELRRKALDAMLETGKDYAAAFGVSEFVPTEFEEEYTLEDVRRPDSYRGRYRIFDMNEDSVDLRVPDIEQCMEVRCKFTN